MKLPSKKRKNPTPVWVGEDQPIQLPSYNYLTVKEQAYIEKHRPQNEHEVFTNLAKLARKLAGDYADISGNQDLLAKYTFVALKALRGRQTDWPGEITVLVNMGENRQEFESINQLSDKIAEQWENARVGAMLTSRLPADPSCDWDPSQWEPEMAQDNSIITPIDRRHLNIFVQYEEAGITSKALVGTEEDEKAFDIEKLERDAKAASEQLQQKNKATQQQTIDAIAHEIVNGNGSFDLDDDSKEKLGKSLVAKS